MRCEPKSSQGPAASGCRLCPRTCGADRAREMRGFCGETDRIRVARAALHYWEEPCISGTRGSGTVFFSGCVLRCVFCQNHELADSSVGRVVSPERLAEIFLEQQERGADNINLVTPTHFAPQIARSLRKATDQGLRIPVVYNTGGYERVETLKDLEGLVDVYLPDFKYLDAGLAGKYSAAPDYPEVAKAALAEMVRQTGTPRFVPEEDVAGKSVDFRESSGVCAEWEEGLIMTRGVIVRHLLLPGFLWDSKEVVRYLLETYGDGIYLSLMSQYTPMPGIGERYPELGRKVKRSSYEKLVSYALDLGLTRGFIQEGDVASESFIPAFDYEGVER